MRVNYAEAVYGKEEKNAVSKLLQSGGFLASGKYTPEFEKQIAKIFGKKFGVMVNSGSSANLIALELLNLPRGSEIITPLLTFGTTLSPILQKGLVPVFADVLEGQYVIDVNQIEKLISKKTKALLIPYLMGNTPDLEKIKSIAKKHHLFIIGDSCDTLNATYKGKLLGFYTDIVTTSFYASHIITAGGGGGMVMFDSPEWLSRAKMFRGWGRSSSAFAESEDIGKRFSAKLGNVSYDAKFLFKEIGYNFIPPEMGAVFGLEQLKKIEKFSKIRKNNFLELHSFFSKYKNFFILPEASSGLITNWLAFPLTIKETAPFPRIELVTYLEKNNIQTRPLFTGNALLHEAFRHIKHRISNNGCPVTEKITKRAFVIGCHHSIGQKELNYIKEVFVKFLDKV